VDRRRPRPGAELDVFVAEVWRGPASERQDAPTPSPTRFAPWRPSARRCSRPRPRPMPGRARRSTPPASAPWPSRPPPGWKPAPGPPTSPGKDPRHAAAAFAAKVLDKRRRKIRKDGKDLAALSPEDRHHLRMRGKTLRYAAEDLATLFPDHPKRAGPLHRGHQGPAGQPRGAERPGRARGLAREVALGVRRRPKPPSPPAG
jgi:triphosphatase